jgi:hypothetical protein
MALPIIETWRNYFIDYHEGLGSSYERIMLNNLLLKLKRRYKLSSVLEVPVFGFTGITGLNSFVLNNAGCEVCLVDHDIERIKYIDNIIKELKGRIKTQYAATYCTLPFEDKSFDMSWNFSALWFTEDLPTFLTELARVTAKVLLICVPNREGLGYKWQKAHTDLPEDIIFHEEFIDPELIKSTMKGLNWKFIREDYIDCPPWPDIGMSKENFLGSLLKKNPEQPVNPHPSKRVSIVDFYNGEDPGFALRIEKYSFLEKYAPDWFKRYWCHHRWLLFASPGL